MGLFKRLFGKKETKPKDEKEPATKPATKKSKTKPKKYHITLNKTPKSPYHNMWRVRKEHSDKTIKHFNTQQEAIDFAAQLAKKEKTELVIHKTDGTIRRQNY